MSEPGIFEIINTTRFGEIYERVRPLIVWLGLGELAWIEPPRLFRRLF
jgi:hypothetical protein